MTQLSDRGTPPRRDPLNGRAVPFRRFFPSLRGCLGGLLALLLVHTSLALDPSRSLHQYNLTSWNRSSGLPGNRINTVAQTADGYLWLGTRAGLVRFDGVNFTSVPATFPGAGGKEVRKVIPRRGGGLFVVINHGGAAAYDGATFAPLTHASWPERLTGKTILQTRGGDVWLGWNLGFTSLASDGGTSVMTQPERVFSLAEARNGGLWVGTEARGVYLLDHGTLTELDPALRSETVAALAVDPDGRLWVGAGTGLKCYDASRQPLPIPALKATVNALHFDRHGVLWIGTTGAGLVRWKDGRYQALTHADGLAGDTVTALAEDSEGNLWVGTTTGLSQLANVKFPIFTAHDGLSGGVGHRLALSRRGGLWYTSSLGFCHFDGRKSTVYPAEEIAGDPYITLVHEARNGDVYLACAGLRILAYAEDKPIVTYAMPGWPSALGEDDKSVLVALSGAMYRLLEGRLVPMELGDGLMPDLGNVTAMCQTPDGAQWFATYRGVIRAKHGRLTEWGTNQGLKDDRIDVIIPDGGNGVWAGSRRGVIRVQGETAVDFTGTSGLPDDKIFGLVADHRGNLWVDSAVGFLRVEVASLEAVAEGRAAEAKVESFAGLEAVKNIDHDPDQRYSGACTPDGRVWFSNSSGLVSIDPDRIAKNTLSPLVHIAAVRAQGRPLAPDRPAQLRVGEESVEFEFAALSFVVPQKIRVQYRLDGVDPRWIEAGPRRSVAYSLRPGSYRFRVQAANEDGVWSAGAKTFSFEIPPPWYQTPAFFTFGSALCVVSLVGAHRLRVRNLRGRQAKLEEMVDQRTSELAHERDLLRRLLSSAPDPILFKDASGRIIKCGQALATMLGARSAADLVGKEDTAFFSEESAARSLEEDKRIMQTGVPVVGAIVHLTLRDSRRRWVLWSKMPLRDEHGRIMGTFCIAKDITELKEAEAKLLQTQQQLLETSRQAGMAEVATAVLHNVGNVLNSVNVSTAMLTQMVQTSKVPSVGRIAALLKEHRDRITEFMAHDPKGQKVPEFLEVLGAQLNAESAALQRELQALTASVDHIKEIVALQQGIARVGGVVEPVAAATLLEDAIRMNGFETLQGVSLIREYGSNPTLTVERHKVIQILVNLVRNAKQACEDGAKPHKEIRLGIALKEDHVDFTVGDNGIGIASDHRDRVFSFGFTTRKTGHGFGLHSSALAARELGGQLTVSSPGAGQGAVFRLTLPLTPPTPK